MARKYLDTTGLTALWAKIVAKINAIGDSFVQKAGDTMTGNLKLESSSNNGIIFKESGYGDKFEIKPSFGGTDDSNYLAIKTATGVAGTDPDTKEKIRIRPSGIVEMFSGDLKLTDQEVRIKDTTVKPGTAPSSNVYGDGVYLDANDDQQIAYFRAFQRTTDSVGLQIEAHRKIGSTDHYSSLINEISNSGDKNFTFSSRIHLPSLGGMWVQGRDVDKNAIVIGGQATNGQSYDGILWNKCYNGNIINIGRITNELDIGYIEAGQTDNALRKFVKFMPADNKVSFGESDREKSYIRLSDGYYSGKAANSDKWNGITDDHNTNNTTDTWVPVYTGSKIQHRVIPTTIAGTTEQSYTRNHSSVSYTEHLRCWRFGNVITLGGYFSCSGSIAANTLLYTLPSPKFVIYFTAKHETANRMYNFNLQTNGQLKTNEAIAGGNYLVCFTYVCT